MGDLCGGHVRRIADVDLGHDYPSGCGGIWAGGGSTGPAQGLGFPGGGLLPGQDLFDSYRSVNERRLVECYHDGLQAREQALQMFNLGYLSLEFRALAEKLGQFEVMDRVEDRHRADVLFGWIAAPSAEDGVDWRVDRLAGWNAAAQARCTAFSP